MEDEKVVEVVLNLDERSREDKVKRDSRRLTLTAVVSVSVCQLLLLQVRWFEGLMAERITMSCASNLEEYPTTFSFP